MKKILLSFIFMFSLIETMYGQTNILTGSQTTCSDVLFDNGGTNSYSNNTNYTYTYTPSTPGSKIQATFVSFDMESGWDFLYVY